MGKKLIPSCALSSSDPSIKYIFRLHLMFKFILEQAKVMYTNDTQRLYWICQWLDECQCTE